MATGLAVPRPLTGLILVALALGLLLAGRGAEAALPQSPPNPSTLRGDVDCDGFMSAPDVTPVLRFVASVPDPQPPCPLAGQRAAGTTSGVPFSDIWGDANCDDVVNVTDALFLLYLNLGLSLPTGGGDCSDLTAPLEFLYSTQPVDIPESWRDLGDAPDGTETGYDTGPATGDFATSVANSGPSHPSPFTVWLGEFVNTEGQHAVPADDGDDGLQALDMPDCGDGAVLVTVNMGGLTLIEREQPVYLNVLGDWNRDGRWQGADSCADEWTVQNQALDLSEADPGSTLDTFVVDVPTGVQAQEAWLRLTLTREQYDPNVGGDIAGETEDYLVREGQILANPPEDEPLAEPQGIREGVARDFYCISVVLGHGEAFVVSDIEQTAESKQSGFQIRNLKTTVSTPTGEAGRPGGGSLNPAKGIEVKLGLLQDGRQRIQLFAQIDSPHDDPPRMEGPFLLTIAMEGSDLAGKAFSGSMTCKFWVDHTEGSIIYEDEAGQGGGGFTGGPGRTDGRPGVEGFKFIMVNHGKQWKGKSDGEGNGKYDKESVTVFGQDGMPITLNPPPKRPKDPPQAPGTGIKKITPSTNGRAIVIETIEDEPTPRVERLFVRVSGKFADDTPFVDYYRVVIVHGKKGQEEAAQRLLDQVSYVPQGNQLLEEGQEFALYYLRGAAAAEFVGQIPPDPDGTDFAAAVLCLADGGTNFQGIMHGSLLFILAYSGGGRDIWLLDGAETEPATAQPQGPGSCTNGSRNITGGGPGNPNIWETGSVCNGGADSWAYLGDLGDFSAKRVHVTTGDIVSVPGGQSHRFIRCVRGPDGKHIITGSTPGPGGTTSWPRIGSFTPCGGLCQQGAGIDEFKDLNIPVDANSHIWHVTISPDLSKIAYTRANVSSSHIWVADFDPATLTTSNRVQLTTEGGNSLPAWSPDSARIAFLSTRSGNNDIWVMDADGTDQLNVTNTPEDEFTPSWQVP